jgi:hypothetical protein
LAAAAAADGKRKKDDVVVEEGVGSPSAAPSSLPAHCEGCCYSEVHYQPKYISTAQKI